MILDPSTYHINQKVINEWTLRKVKEGPFDYLGEPGYISLATSVPIIIVDYFVGEVLDWPVEMRKKIASDMKFYHVDKVVGYII